MPRVLFLIALFFSAVSFAVLPDCGKLLSPDQRAALERVAARPVDFAVHVLKNGEGRTVVLLGERPFLGDLAFQWGKGVIETFPRIGREAVTDTPAHPTWAHQYALIPLSTILGGPEWVLGLLWNAARRGTDMGFNGSLSYAAQLRGREDASGTTVINLEANHRPDRYENVASLIRSVDHGSGGICLVTGCAFLATGSPVVGAATVVTGVVWSAFRLARILAGTSYFPRLRRWLDYRANVFARRGATVSDAIPNAVSDGPLLVILEMPLVASVLSQLQAAGFVDAVKSPDAEGDRGF